MLPDKIEQRGVGAYLFYFTDGKDINRLPANAEYTVVYSPAGYTGKWHVSSFRVVRHPSKETTVARTLTTRLLEPDEIAHFEALIENNFPIYHAE
jgi:hypothetical protein